MNRLAIVASREAQHSSAISKYNSENASEILWWTVQIIG
jgi:hypothetical protein